MSIEIENLEVSPSMGGLSNVITALHWRVYVDTARGRLSRCGVAKLGQPNPTVFTSIEDVTQEQALAWLDASVDGGLDALTASVETSLNKPNNHVSPPWASQEASE